MPWTGAYVAVKQDAGAWDAVGATVPAGAASAASAMPRIYIGSKYLYDAGAEGVIERVVIYGRTS